MINTYTDNGAPQSNATGASIMMRGSKRTGPDTEHDSQYSSVSPQAPSWKFYDNPFFTEGHLVPKYIPRYMNAPLHRGANSFTTSGAQFTSRLAVPNSHPGLITVAPNLATKAPFSSDATSPQPKAFIPWPIPSPHLFLSKDKFTQGSLIVSARKLAASFWEQYGVPNLAQAHPHPASDVQNLQPFLQTTSNTLACSCMPPKFQIPEALQDSVSVCETGDPNKNNMASSPMATVANVIHRMRSMEESQSQSTAMLSKLTLEMEDVVTRVQELEFSHKSALREINSLLQKFGEQVAISRRKEQEKARLTFLHLREEVEAERNACRVLKIQNKKLTKDLTSANLAAADACEELERERKARELLEEVCNELAREIGEDKAEVEQLKQEQADSRKRLEEEIRMMEIAAMWRGDRARSDLTEVQLELNHEKKSTPLQELRSKLEAFVSTIGVPCRGTKEEMEKQAEYAKLLRQAQELLDLEKSTENQTNAKDVVPATQLRTGPAFTNVCIIDEKVSSNTEYGEVYNTCNGDADTVDGLDSKFSSRQTRKPRKARRRPRTGTQQRHSLGIRSKAWVHDSNNVNFWENHCASSSWPTSDDELEEGKLTKLQNLRQGDALEEGAKEHSLHVYSKENILRVSGHVMHSIQNTRPSVFVSASVFKVKKEPCHLEQNVAKGETSHRKLSLSARFDAGREVDCKLETDTGPSLQYSFSEDDAASYMGNRIERRRKQQGALRTQSMLGSKSGQKEEVWCKFIRNDQSDHNHPDRSERRGRTEAVTENSELDDFYFEPLKGPNYARLNSKVNETEDGTISSRQQEWGFSNCGDEACCSIMAKASQGCKDFKDKVHESAESTSVLVEGSANFGGKEAINKISPWRSASVKPLPCFWPPSPDAFSIFGGGAKKRSKAGSSPPPVYIHNEQQMKSVDGLRSQSHRHASPAKEASYQLSGSQQQHHVCMKNNSLGAQLIKARELDHEKPRKPSFRFSPLRRAISQG